jgi:gamma-tubulin complex component 3
MARLVEGVGPLYGGALASRLHGHSMHGDPAISSMVQRIMNSVCSPLYSMINRWILHGELLDPNKEVHFFVFLTTIP